MILAECEPPLKSIARNGVSQQWYRNIARYGATKSLYLTSYPTEKIKKTLYRGIGVAMPPSHRVSCGIADYRCYTPISFHKHGLSQSKDRPNKGASQKKLASEAYCAAGDVARNGHDMGPLSFCIYMRKRERASNIRNLSQNSCSLPTSMAANNYPFECEDKCYNSIRCIPKTRNRNRCVFKSQI